MVKIKHSVSMLIASAALLMGIGASASVPVNPTDYTGSRASGAGLTGTTPWSSPGGFTIGWQITQSGSTFHYLYNLTIPQKNPSHILLSLSNNITPQNFDSLFSNFTVNGVTTGLEGPQLYTPGGQGNSNPGLPGNLYGIKINFSVGAPIALAFDSLRAPMWGDFYSKDGVQNDHGNKHDVYIYNSGFGTAPVPNFQNWIAVPDTHEIGVPEPATYALLASCLALGLLRARRREPKATA